MNTPNTKQHYRYADPYAHPRTRTQNEPQPSLLGIIITFTGFISYFVMWFLLDITGALMKFGTVFSFMCMFSMPCLIWGGALYYKGWWSDDTKR